MEACVGESLPPSVAEKGGEGLDEPQALRNHGKIGKIQGEFKVRNGHRVASPQVDEEEGEAVDEEEEMVDEEEEEEEEFEEEYEELDSFRRHGGGGGAGPVGGGPGGVGGREGVIGPQGPGGMEEEEDEEDDEDEEEEEEEDPHQQQQHHHPHHPSHHHHNSSSYNNTSSAPLAPGGGPHPPISSSSSSSSSRLPPAGAVGLGAMSAPSQAVIPRSNVELNGHNPHRATEALRPGGKADGGGDGAGNSVYDFDPGAEGSRAPPPPLPQVRDPSSAPALPPDRRDHGSASSDGSIKREPELHTLDDSEMAEDGSVIESYDGDDCDTLEDSVSEQFEGIPRRGRGRPRGSKNRTDGRGRGRGLKFRRLSEDRTCTAYDLRNIPDPFANQRRGRPRSRFIVDLGEQNHEAWCKNKEELNISDAELTTLLLSLLESRRDCTNTEDSDTMLGLISSEYNKWKEKFASQVSMLSHYASIHNTNCCTCLGIKKKKYIPAGTGKRGRPRKYPPPVGCEYYRSSSDGPGMQRPDTIDEDGNIFEPQIILKDGMVVKSEPSDENKGLLRPGDETGPHGGMANTSNGGSAAGIQMLPRPILTKEEIEKRREYYNNHKNKVKYVCHYCQVHFYHKPNFDYHISKLESSGKCKIYEKINNLYLCESCGEGFSWREKLEKHLRLAEQHGTHNQKELLMYGDFQCNMCGKTFNKRTTYLQHVKWHEDREDIPCVICGTMFKQVDLRHHLMEVHSNDSLPCCYCGKLFTSRKYLEKHELIHQGGNFPCPECGKTFSQKSNMQQHLKTHTLDKEYSCDHCGQQTFNQRAGLCQHLRKHFGPAEFSHECEVCGQYFSSDYNLKLHKKKIHNMHIEGLQDELSDHHSEYLSSPIHSHLSAAEDAREKAAYGAANSAVKNMLGVSLGSSLSLSSMKQEGANESMDDGGQIHMRDTASHMAADMRHLTDRRGDTPGLMKDTLEAEEHHMRMTQHHSMAVSEEALHMPQDLTRMTASQAHMSDESGRMSAAPQSQHMSDMRNSVGDSPGRITDTPHMTTDNLGRMAVAENFGRMTGTPGGYLAEHLRRMAENQSRMSDSMSHYDERDNYSRLGDNLRSMSRGSASDPMGRLGDNLGRMTADNLSHMGVIRPTQTPSSTPQWPPHMQNHAAALDGMNQSSQASQHALYPLPFWPYDPSLRQYHH
ncbi:uncharacterized protein [Palaemon carinicauda]|uniref:uncharacterized protein isoform X2 n=1 Tax=Palaemon carinicauda TaxID=392227 RepID=UPI0035B662DF